MSDEAKQPAEIQFPGLLNAIVNDALADGVSPVLIIGALEIVKGNVAMEVIEQAREHQQRQQQTEPLIIPFNGPVPKGDGR